MYTGSDAPRHCAPLAAALHKNTAPATGGETGAGRDGTGTHGVGSRGEGWYRHFGWCWESAHGDDTGWNLEDCSTLWRFTAAEAEGWWWRLVDVERLHSPNPYTGEIDIVSIASTRTERSKESLLTK